MDTIIVENDIGALFIIGLIISVIIAYGVQFLLSLLSLATGVSFTPNLKKKSAEMKAASLKKGDRFDYSDDEDDEHSISSMVITSAVGFWVLLTATLALFSGTYFGLSIIPLSPYSAVIAALVIWSLFFISLLYLEYKAVHTIVGGLISSALGGMRASASAVGHMLTPSEASKGQKQARKTVRAIYDEVNTIVKKDNVDERLEDYIQRLTPNMPTKRDIVKDVKKLINQLEIEERTNISDGEVQRVLDVHVSKSPKVSKEDMQKLKSGFDSARSAADQHDSKADKALAIIDSIAPISDSDAKEHRTKIAELLNRTSKDELNAEAFKTDLETLFDDPKAGKDQIIARLKHFDKATLKELAHNIDGVDNATTDKLIDTASSAINGLMNSNATQYQGEFSNNQTLSEKAEQRLIQYFDSLDHDGLDYHGIKRDIQRIFETPGSAPDIIRNRLNTLDKDAVIALLSSNSRISEEKAEKIADSVLTARDNAANTIDTVQTEVTRRLDNARRKAVIVAEHTRRNTIVASWWLVASAVTSAVGAIAGAYLTSIN